VPIGIRSPAPVRLVFVGPSHLYLPAPPDDVDTRAWQMLGGLPTYAKISVEHGGEGWSDLGDRFSEEVAHLGRTRPGCESVLVMAPTPIDIAQEATAEEAYDFAVSFADRARAAGFDYVIACTSPYVGEVYDIFTPVDVAGGLLAYNALMVADASEAFDAVVRADTAPLDDPYDTTYFLADQLHLAAAGGEALAAKIAEAIETVLA
jgi:hypothetical protein